MVSYSSEVAGQGVLLVNIYTICSGENPAVTDSKNGDRNSLSKAPIAVLHVLCSRVFCMTSAGLPASELQGCLQRDRDSNVFTVTIDDQRSKKQCHDISGCQKTIK